MSMMCNVCLRVGTRDFPLLFCDGKSCDLAFHPSCYGVPPSELASSSQKWYCKRCEPHSTIRSTKVKCFACPQKAGALKFVADEQFTHVVCALWLDGVSFGNEETMQPVKIDRKALPMSGLACYICHEANKGKDVVTMGYTQKCHADGCDRRMHVTCAQDNGLLHVPLADGILDRSQKDDMVLYCATHKETTPESSPGKVGRKSAEQPGVVLQDGTVIRVGDHIKAFWKGGRILYEGTVAGINADETISINYHDGDYEDNVEKERIRPRLMVRVAKSAAAKTMAEQAKGDKKKVAAVPPTTTKATAASGKAVAVPTKAPPSSSSKVTSSAGKAAVSSNKATSSSSKATSSSTKTTSSSKGSSASGAGKVDAGTSEGKADSGRGSQNSKGAGAKRKGSGDAVISPPVAKRANVVKASVVSPPVAKRTHSGVKASTSGASSAGVSADTGETTGVHRRASTSTPAAVAGAGASMTRASKDPQDTPYADLIENALKDYMEEDGQKVLGFLFRAHGSSDTDVLTRLKMARVEHKELTAEVGRNKDVLGKHVHKAEELFAPLPAPAHVVAASVGDTAEARSNALKRSLAVMLGVSTAKLEGDKVAAQIKSMSDAIDRSVGM
eukprot:m.195001 g.195001  ORF g.195001 m.195001 type:complete len:615 (-) comp19359_c0_seq1:66-1910(-)